MNKQAHFQGLSSSCLWGGEMKDPGNDVGE